MNLRDRIGIALRALFSRDIQVADEYIDGVHVTHAKARKGSSSIRREHVEPFGYASRAPDGSENIVLSLGGKRSHSVVLIAHNRSYKFQLNPGETSIYNQFGDHVHLKDNGEAHIKASAKVFAETPLFETSADCLVGGNLTVVGNTQHQGTTQLMQTTTVEAGNFVCGAQAVFTSLVGFTGGVAANGIDIGEGHQHANGTLPDGRTGTVSNV